MYIYEEFYDIINPIVQMNETWRFHMYPETIHRFLLCKFFCILYLRLYIYIYF